MDQPVNGVPVDVVSIAELRADASRISRAFVAVGLLPVLFLLMILRDLQLPAWMATLFGAASLGVGLSLAHQGQDFTAGTLKSAVWVFGVFMALTAVCALALIAAIVSSASERNRPDALGKTRSSYPPAPDQGRVSGQPPAVHSRCRGVGAVFAYQAELMESQPAAAETTPSNFTRNTFLPFHRGAQNWYEKNAVSSVIRGD